MKNYCCPLCGGKDKLVVKLSRVTGLLVQNILEEDVSFKNYEADYTLRDTTKCEACLFEGQLILFDEFAEYLLDATELRHKYMVKQVNEHPCFTFNWWKSEVANRSIVDGYWAWVLDQLKKKNDELSGYYVRRDLIGKRVVEFDQLVPGHKTVGDLIWVADLHGIAAHKADYACRIIPAWQSFVLSWRP